MGLLWRLSVPGLGAITGADYTPHPGLVRDPVRQEVRKNTARACTMFERSGRSHNRHVSLVLYGGAGGLLGCDAV
jgi:hypothetical protein